MKKKLSWVHTTIPHLSYVMETDHVEEFHASTKSAPFVRFPVSYVRAGTTPLLPAYKPKKGRVTLRADQIVAIEDLGEGAIVEEQS